MTVSTTTGMPVYPEAAQVLRDLADARAEYVHDPDDLTDAIAREVDVARQLAAILDGEPGPATGWLPSWRWTDELCAWASGTNTPAPGTGDA